MMFDPNPPGRPAVIAGLCADLAQEFSLPQSLVRAIVLVCALLPTAITYMLLAWLSERRQGRARFRPGRAGTATESPALLLAVQRLRGLETRLSGMEAFIASRDFELHKGFRTIRP